jgi:hypothetical protein
VAPRSIDLQLVRNEASRFKARAERLRQGRAAAPVLRELSANAAFVELHLRFHSDDGCVHADQSFVLYPAATAYFGFPCPYGDCDGIYDLAEVTRSALHCATPMVAGSLTCAGTRSRQRTPGRPCGLEVRYTVTVERALNI